MAEAKLGANNERLVKEIITTDPNYFKKLSEGQTPDYFVISCSDSRVSPSVISDLPLGTIFVHRNIANQVHHEDDSLTASLYYALKYLKVKEIVIEGHTGCGGIKAARDGLEDKELKSWLNIINSNLPQEDAGISYPELSKANVLKQVENLKNHPVYKEYGHGVEIRGCLFDIETGKLERII